MPKFRRDLLHRYEGNPIIDLEDIPFKCNTVFNAGAVKTEEGYKLLLRVENLQGRSVFVMAHSEDGYHFEVDDFPVMEPAGQQEPFRTYEANGIEDPRITFLEGQYYICYTAASQYGPRIGLARTRDFHQIERVGLISEPENKDATLFPRKLGGRYVRLDRPLGGGMGNVWISYSPDLRYWGDARVLFTPRPGYWDSDRVGASSQPIETDQGWLEIYHGVKFTSSGPIYRLGAVLLDPQDPSRMIGRTLIPLLTPREMYERVGDVDNVVFSCGAILEDDGELRVYYGAADTCICLATAPLQDVLKACIANDRA